MAVPGFTNGSFTAGEVPTTSVWNELWSNDSAFNTFLTGPNTIKSTLLALSNALDSTNGVLSQTNVGTAGGTMWWINLGGMKFLWFTSGFVTSSNGGSSSAVTLPAFFTTIQAAICSVESQATFGNQTCAVDTLSTSSISVKSNCPSGTATQEYSVFAIGT